MPVEYGRRGQVRLVMVAGRCDKWVAAGVLADKDGIIHSGVASTPSKGDPVGNSGMEMPGVYPVEVVTAKDAYSDNGGT
jgi:hypothetical protein